MKTLYLDCFSGISGDMVVGAFIDLGLPLNFLKVELHKLSLDGYELDVKRVKKNSIDSANFSVQVEEKQKARDYKGIKNMIEGSSLKNDVKALSLKIFDLLVEAEGKIHAVPPEDVHFHEIGCVDSIVDIVSTAIGMDYLDISHVYSSNIVTGTGMVMTDHGCMPVPAPATAEILKGVPVSNAAVEGELVTPTGAAILKAIAKKFGPMPEMNVEKIGYGAGDKDWGERPNLLRIFLGETLDKLDGAINGFYDRDEVLVMETAIDDMNPQFFENMVEGLFSGGALDVVLIPVYMKKGRPGTLLQVIASPEKQQQVARVIFSGSTSIGIRSYRVDRMKLKRGEEMISTSLGEVRVKTIEMEKGKVELRPEYDDLKKLAKLKGMSMREVNSIIQQTLLSKREKDFV
ncbi:MAG: nickel pincer cofactor biosynthesis protein LarC [Proteobacteria bacterium]|nr:nickel pincer cofactor biosynthesis protein LarC [Pseudomonadota bacterium]